jgi:glucose/arabinose dehydrogenase
MKKILAVVMALVFALTVTAAFAQQPAAKPAEPAKKAEPAKPAEPAKKDEKADKKEKVQQITGEVTAIDTVGKTITVKSKKKELTVAVTDEQIKDVKAGDKVVVKYTEKDGKATAKSVKKVAAKAEKKGEVKKEEKKAEPAAKPAEKKQ